MSRARAERDEVDEERAGQGAPEGDRVEFEVGGCCDSDAVMLGIDLYSCAGDVRETGSQPKI